MVADVDWDTPARGLPLGSARSMLLTVLGTFVAPDGEPVWTSALLYVMTGLGMEEQTARQAISRAADADLIANERHGRIVCWRITDKGAAAIAEITRRAESLVNPPERWDGRCIVLAVTVPQRLRAVRKRLYSALYWQGFGNPAPGLWASPHVDRVAELRELIDDLGLRDSAITFIGGTLGVGLTDPEIVERAWDLAEIAARYEKFLETFQDLRPEPGDDVLFAHIALLNEFREFPAMDPQLPEDLLPEWVGRRATEVAVGLHERWAPESRRRWREIVAATAPG